LARAAFTRSLAAALSLLAAASSSPATGSMSTAAGCSTWCWATATRSGCTGCPRASTPRLSAADT